MTIYIRPAIGYPNASNGGEAMMKQLIERGNPRKRRAILIGAIQGWRQSQLKRGVECDIVVVLQKYDQILREN
jgi:hypothetical protein